MNLIMRFLWYEGFDDKYVWIYLNYTYQVQTLLHKESQLKSTMKSSARNDKKYIKGYFIILEQFWSANQRSCTWVMLLSISKLLVTIRSS